jgi:hypothetical protein
VGRVFEVDITECSADWVLAIIVFAHAVREQVFGQTQTLNHLLHCVIGSTAKVLSDNSECEIDKALATIFCGSIFTQMR